MNDRRVCPHKSVKAMDTRGEIYPRERWVCEWCSQEFIPATTDDDPIKVLMAESNSHMTIGSDFFNDQIREAYRRGKASK